jgi:hypothetical protein
MPASFGSGNDVPASFPNININEWRWTQEEHKIFMQEYEKYGNNCTQVARVLSTWTPAQIKKHAECFFKQNLKPNSAAVKWYWESLSPNKKAQVLVNNTDAHWKQRESVPPEKKVKMLETNAAAHKKQPKSLSPDDKSQILNKDADAHRKKWEYLSPEDKDLFVKDNTAAQHTLAARGLEELRVNLLLTWRNWLGYPAHTGLISLSVCLFVCPSGIWKHVEFSCRNWNQGVHVEYSVHRPSPPITYSYVREENLGSTRKFVQNYLLFTCTSNLILAIHTQSVNGLKEPF